MCNNSNINNDKISRSEFLYARLKNGTYYVLALYGRVGRQAYVRCFLLTKNGTRKNQGKTKTKFEPGEIDFISKVTKII